jgi:hypothetical protein
MPELSTDIIVAVPADRVWDVIGRRFDRIGDWATAIPVSTALRHNPAAVDSGLPVAAVDLDAPVAGRVCHTGIRLVPQVTETLTAYNDTNRTLTYHASAGMPAFVTLARNTWTVTPLDSRRSRVSLHARFDTRGLLGLFGRWAILARTHRASRHLADDLRHYVETGQPSPRKLRQLRRPGRVTTL